MNGEDRHQLELLKAEMIRRLDLLLEKVTNLQGVTKDHEKRIRMNERFRFALPTVSVGALATAIITLIKVG